MMKTVCLTVVVVFSHLMLQAQENKTLELGLGSISNFYPIKHKDKVYEGTGIGSGLRIGYEQDLKQLSTGKLTLGGIMVIGSSRANYALGKWKSEYQWRHTVLAARLAYQYPYDEKLDLYGGLHFGVQFERFRQVYSVSPPASYTVNNYNHGAPYTGLFFGAGYKLSKNIGAFAELGYDLMWFTLGAKVYL